MEENNKKDVNAMLENDELLQNGSEEELQEDDFEEEEDNEYPNDNKNFLNTKNKQILIAISIFIILMIKKKDSNDDLITLKNGKNKIVISDLSDGATAQDMWIQNSEQKIKNLELTNKKQEEYSIKLEEKIRKLENELGVLEEVNYQTNQNKINSVAQQEQISALYEELKSLRTKQLQNPYAGTYDNTTGQIVPQARTIETIELNLESSSSSNSNNTFNIKDYIPAGSYAPATVISGVDASTGLAASGDPRPVLFRITGEAISSGYKGKKQKTDLEGCTVTGAASADLSSEKVYVRLLKMTCSRKKGTVTEIEVQ
jgi:hypothetical protein